VSQVQNNILSRELFGRTINCGSTVLLLLKLNNELYHLSFIFLTAPEKNTQVTCSKSIKICHGFFLFTAYLKQPLVFMWVMTFWEFQSSDKCLNSAKQICEDSHQDSKSKNLDQYRFTLTHIVIRLDIYMWSSGSLHEIWPIALMIQCHNIDSVINLD
jgi:hypothetical protein